MNTFPQSDSHFFIPGTLGRVEVLTTYPKFVTQRIAVICHPHPRHQGTMHNKVVTSLTKAFDGLGLATLRFNFRGVGASEGPSATELSSEGVERNYECEGELDDLRAVLHWVNTVWSDAKLSLAGFSFGSYVAAKIAEEFPPEILVSIAPPVERMPFADLKNIHCPWIVVQGEEDEIVSSAAVYAWAAHAASNVELIRMPETGHFFHGKLVELRELLIQKLNVSHTP